MFNTLLEILKNDFNFPENAEYQDYNINSLTTQRVLLSDDFAHYFNFFGITSKLQEKLYNLYYFDDKKITSIQNTLNFNDTIFKNINQKEEFYTSKFWQYDSEKNILRKFSEQMIAPEGRFYEKNIKESYQEIIETKINNAELLLTRYRYKSEEEIFENFNWFYGKQPQTDGYTIRFYLNVMPDSTKIAELINVITKEFDDAGVPFVFKYLSDPQIFNERSDVAVLYAPRKNALLVFDLVRRIYEKNYEQSFYCEKAPLFTEKLAHGLSFGENPDDRRYTSFGSYRSIYIALAIIKYYYLEKKNMLPDEAELKRLLDSNLDTDNCVRIKKWTDEFYLNQFSKHNYSDEISYFKHNLFKHNNSSQRNNNNLINDSASHEYINSAYLIAQIISSEAHFYPSKNEGFYMHCNWISYNSTNFSSINGKNNKKQVTGYQFKAMNSSFIEGRLGVAHFLKQLLNVKKDQNIYRIFYRTFQGVIESLKDKNELESHLNELKWFYEKNTDGLLVDVPFTLFLRKSPNSTPPIFKTTKRNNLSELHKIIDKVISTDYSLSNSEIDIIKSTVQDLKEEKPYINFYGNEEMCLSISSGYALFGYFFLRLYDKQKFPPLPFQFEDK